MSSSSDSPNHDQKYIKTAQEYIRTVTKVSATGYDPTPIQNSISSIFTQPISTLQQIVKDELESAQWQTQVDSFRNPKLKELGASLIKNKESERSQREELEAKLKQSSENTMLQLQEQKEQYDKEIQEHLTKISQFEQTNHQQEEEISTLKKEKEDIEAQIVSLNQQIVDIEKEKAAQSDELKKNEGILTEKEAEIQGKQEELDTKSKEIEELRRENSVMQANFNGLTSESTKEKGAMKDLQDKHDKLDTHVKQLMVLNTALTKDKEHLEKKVSELEELRVTIKDQSTQIQELERAKQQNETEIAQLKDKSADLQRKIDEQAQQISSREAEIAEMKSQAAIATKQIEENQAEIATNRQTIDDLEKKLEQSEATATSLNSTVTTLTTNLDSKTTEANDLQKRAELAEAKIAELQKDLDHKVLSLTDLGSSSNAQIEESRNRIVELQQKLEQSQANEASLNSTVTSLTTDLNTKTSEAGDLQKRVEDAEALIIELQKDLDNKESSLSDLGSSSSAQIQEAKKQIDDLTKKLEKSEAKATSLNSIVTSMTTELGTKTTEAHDLQQRAESAEARIKELETVLEEKEASLAEVGSSSSSQIDQLNKKLQKAEAKATSLNSIVTSMTSDLGAKTTEANDLLHRAESAEARIKELEADLEAKEASLAEVGSSSTAQIDQLNKKLQKAEAKATSLNSIVTSMTSDLGSKTTEANDLLHRAESAESRIKELESDLEARETSLAEAGSSSAAQIDQLNKKLQKAEAKATSLNSIVTSMTTDLGSKTTEANDLLKRAETAEAQIEQLNKKLQKSEAKSTSLNSIVTSMTSDLGAKTSEANDLQQRAESAEARIKELETELEAKEASHAEAGSSSAAQIDLLNKKLQKAEAKATSLNSIVTSMTTDLGSKTTEANDLLHRAESSEARIKELEADLEAKEDSLAEVGSSSAAQIDQLTKKLQKAEAKATSLNSIVTSMTSDLGSKTTEANDLLQRAESAEARNKELEQSVTNADDKSKTDHAKLADLVKKCKEFKARAETLATEKQAIETKNTKLTTIAKKHKASSDAATKQVTALEATLKTQISEHELLINHASALESQHAVLKQSVVEQIQNLPITQRQRNSIMATFDQSGPTRPTTVAVQDHIQALNTQMEATINALQIPDEEKKQLLAQLKAHTAEAMTAVGANGETISAIEAEAIIKRLIEQTRADIDGSSASAEQKAQQNAALNAQSTFGFMAASQTGPKAVDSAEIEREKAEMKAALLQAVDQTSLTAEQKAALKRTIEHQVDAIDSQNQSKSSIDAQFGLLRAKIEHELVLMAPNAEDRDAILSHASSTSSAKETKMAIVTQVASADQLNQTRGDIHMQIDSSNLSAAEKAKLKAQVDAQFDVMTGHPISQDEANTRIKQLQIELETTLLADGISADKMAALNDIQMVTNAATRSVQLDTADQTVDFVDEKSAKQQMTAVRNAMYEAIDQSSLTPEEKALAKKKIDSSLDISSVNSHMTKAEYDAAIDASMAEIRMALSNDAAVLESVQTASDAAKDSTQTYKGEKTGALTTADVERQMHKVRQDLTASIEQLNIDDETKARMMALLIQHTNAAIESAQSGSMTKKELELRLTTMQTALVNEAQAHGAGSDISHFEQSVAQTRRVTISDVREEAPTSFYADMLRNIDQLNIPESEREALKKQLSAMAAQQPQQGGAPVQTRRQVDIVDQAQVREKSHAARDAINKIIDESSLTPEQKEAEKRKMGKMLSSLSTRPMTPRELESAIDLIQSELEADLPEADRKKVATAMSEHKTILLSIDRSKSTLKRAGIDPVVVEQNIAQIQQEYIDAINQSDLSDAKKKELIALLRSKCDNIIQTAEQGDMSKDEYTSMVRALAATLRSEMGGSSDIVERSISLIDEQTPADEMLAVDTQYVLAQLDAMRQSVNQQIDQSGKSDEEKARLKAAVNARMIELQRQVQSTPMTKRELGLEMEMLKHDLSSLGDDQITQAIERNCTIIEESAPEVAGGAPVSAAVDRNQIEADILRYQTALLAQIDAMPLTPQEKAQLEKNVKQHSLAILRNPPATSREVELQFELMQRDLITEIGKLTSLDASQKTAMIQSVNQETSNAISSTKSHDVTADMTGLSSDERRQLQALVSAQTDEARRSEAAKYDSERAVYLAKIARLEKQQARLKHDLGQQLDSLNLTPEQKQMLHDAIDKSTQSTEPGITKNEFKHQIVSLLKTLEHEIDQTDISPEAKAELKKLLRTQSKEILKIIPDKMTKHDAALLLTNLRDNVFNDIAASSVLTDAEKMTAGKQISSSIGTSIATVEADKSVAVVDIGELAKQVEHMLSQSTLSEAQKTEIRDQLLGDPPHTQAELDSMMQCIQARYNTEATLDSTAVCTKREPVGAVVNPRDVDDMVNTLERNITLPPDQQQALNEELAKIRDRAQSGEMTKRELELQMERAVAELRARGMNDAADQLELQYSAQLSRVREIQSSPSFGSSTVTLRQQDTIAQADRLAEELIAQVNADSSLTPEQKAAKIAQIRNASDMVANAQTPAELELALSILKKDFDVSDDRIADVKRQVHSRPGEVETLDQYEMRKQLRATEETMLQDVAQSQLSDDEKAALTASIKEQFSQMNPQTRREFELQLSILKAQLDAKNVKTTVDPASTANSVAVAKYDQQALLSRITRLQDENETFLVGGQLENAKLKAEVAESTHKAETNLGKAKNLAQRVKTMLEKEREQAEVHKKTSDKLTAAVARLKTHISNDKAAIGMMKQLCPSIDDKVIHVATQQFVAAFVPMCTNRSNQIAERLFDRINLKLKNLIMQVNDVVFRICTTHEQCLKTAIEYENEIKLRHSAETKLQTMTDSYSTVLKSLFFPSADLSPESPPDRVQRQLKKMRVILLSVFQMIPSAPTPSKSLPFYGILMALRKSLLSSPDDMGSIDISGDISITDLANEGSQKDQSIFFTQQRLIEKLQKELQDLKSLSQSMPFEILGPYLADLIHEDPPAEPDEQAIIDLLEQVKEACESVDTLKKEFDEYKSTAHKLLKGIGTKVPANLRPIVAKLA